MTQKNSLKVNDETFEETIREAIVDAQLEFESRRIPIQWPAKLSDLQGGPIFLLPEIDLAPVPVH